MHCARFRGSCYTDFIGRRATCSAHTQKHGLITRQAVRLQRRYGEQKIVMSPIAHRRQTTPHRYRPVDRRSARNQDIIPSQLSSTPGRACRARTAHTHVRRACECASSWSCCVCRRVPPLIRRRGDSADSEVLQQPRVGRTNELLTRPRRRRRRLTSYTILL